MKPNETTRVRLRPEDFANPQEVTLRIPYHPGPVTRARRATVALVQGALLAVGLVLQLAALVVVGAVLVTGFLAVLIPCLVGFIGEALVKASKG